MDHLPRFKILTILHLPPPIHGAAVVGNIIVNSAYINGRFDIDFINLSTSRTLLEIKKGGFNKIMSLLRIVRLLLQSVRKRRPDLCYMTISAVGYGFYKDLIIVFLLKIFRIPILYHFHNKGVSKKQHLVLDNLLYQFAFRNTKSILLSPFLYSDIRKYVQERDVYYCPNGIPEVKACDLVTKSTIGKTEGSCRLLFVSNMMSAKGVFDLLSACKLLTSRGHNFFCDFVGDWSDISEELFKEHVSALGLDQYVFSHGKKVGHEKLDFFRNSDVFVFPTLDEAFGLVNLEAMQFGLPIVSTREGGIPEVVVDGKTGFLVEKGDCETLAKKIEILLNEPDLRLKMGAAGKARYNEFFTVEKFEERIVEIFNSLIGQQVSC